MAPSAEERIEKLLDQLESQDLSESEIARIEKKIKLIRSLEE